MSTAVATPATRPDRPPGPAKGRLALVWVARKLARLLPVLLIVTFTTFAMVRLLPGDPARAFLGPEATQQQVDLLRAELGLDQNVFVGYVQWLGDVFSGDLGASYRTGVPVIQSLSERFPVSLELMILAQIVALAIAIPVGVYTAYRAGGATDRTWSGLAYATIATPGFVLGLLLIYIFPVSLNMLQVSGFTRFTDDPLRNLQSVVLPTITLALTQVAVYSRLLRSDMIATLQEDYMTMARAKGLPTARILLGHALRPSSFSLMTLAGMNVGQMISGAVIVEFLFGLPGIGQLVVDSILTRDLQVLQGAVLFIVVGYVLLNITIDGLYTVIDPRVRGAAANV